MKLKTTLTILGAARAARVPVLMWGTPGIGKTELLEALGRITDRLVETVILSQREPADINGLPVVDDDGAVSFAPPAFAKNLVNAGGGLLFLDELSTAPPANQAAGLRLIKDGVAGDTALPEDTHTVAAANPVDVAAGGWDLEPPTANRFMHVDYKPDMDVWMEGMAVGFDKATSRVASQVRLAPGDDRAKAAATAVVTGFLRAKPGLWDACPDDPSKAGRAWPSPRTWTYVRQVLAYLPPEEEEAIGIAVRGLVGDAAANEFLTWMQHNDLPNPADVLDGTVTVDFSDRIDRVFAILNGVTSYAINDGGEDAWTKAFEVLGQAQEQGKGDLAAIQCKQLGANRPKGVTKFPKQVRAMFPMLEEAKLLD